MYTTLFIIYSLFFTITAGAFFALIYNCNSSRKGMSKKIISIIIMLLVGCLIGGVLTLETAIEDNIWNDGIHTECGGNWELFDIERTKGGHDLFYYKCDKCDYTVRLSAYY